MNTKVARCNVICLCLPDIRNININNFVYHRKNLLKDKEKDDCGCDSCECDDLIPMLDRPLTKKELKEVNMKPKINDFSKKTKVSGMGGVGGPIDVIRGKKQTPTNEPREENDPNPTQK